MKGRLLQSLPSTDDGDDNDGSGDSKSPEYQILVPNRHSWLPQTILSLLATMRFKFYIKFLFNHVYFLSIYMYQDVFITIVLIVSMYKY